MHMFSGRSANDVYAEMVSTVMAEGALVPSRNGDTRETHPAIVELTEPRQRLVTAYGRPVNVAFALSEVLWILGGRTDVEMLKFYNSRIGQWSDDGQSFNAPYGHRMRHAFGFDQLDDVIRTLRHDPGSRQAIINVWNPEKDRGWDEVPSHNGGVGDTTHVPHVTKDRACNVLAHLMIRDGMLDWLQIVRSNDLMWGVPYNWMQWTHVQEYVAAALNIPVGRYIHVADSLHIYDYHWSEAENVEAFDLYQHYGGHADMRSLDRWQLDNLLEDERLLRTAPPDEIHVGDWDNLYGRYWAEVLHLLNGHRMYRMDQDETALAILRNGDQVYGAAQARFYYSMRWYKVDGMDDLIHEFFKPEVADWICTRYEA